MRRRTGRAKAWKRVLSAAIVIALAVLHQDVWNWRAASPLVFGFLPPGLAHHAAFSLLSVLALAALVRLLWPGHLEPDEP